MPGWSNSEWEKLNASRGPQGLRNAIVAQFDSPGPQIFCQHPEIEPLRNLVFDADISRRVVELSNDGEKLFITSAPSSYQGVFFPHGRPTRKSTAPARSRELRLLKVNGPASRMAYPLTEMMLNNELVVMYTNCRNKFWFISQETRSLCERFPVSPC